MEDFNFEDFKASALEQLKEGKPVLGKDGVFAPLLEHLLNAALEGEMDAHMGLEERSGGNRRNGYSNKQVQSSVGELSISTPRDRDATFDPVMVKKRERILADSMADRIIGLYAVGTSTREISCLMEEQFDNRISRRLSPRSQTVYCRSFRVGATGRWTPFILSSGWTASTIR